MKPTILVYKPFKEKSLEKLRQHAQVEYFPGNDPDDPAFLKVLQKADGLIGSGMKVDKALLEKAPNLKMIANKSVGYDNLDVDLLKERGIKASNTPGVLDDTVADTIMALILSTARRVAELDRYVKEGGWAQGPLTKNQFGVDVHHKKLGIIGMGRIGQVVAKRANFGFDMPILYHNRSRNAEAERTYNASYCTLDELLEQSDFVCVMTPLTPKTKGLIGKREFEKMKKSAIFINASRGAVVDEQALVEALNNGIIWGAGLDVFENEPLRANHPFLSMKNVVTLPHIGSATEETRDKMEKLAVENIIAGLTGKKLKTPIF